MSTTDKITRTELEQKFRSLQEGGKAKATDARATLAKAGVGAGLLLLIIFFLLGQRRGKRKTTLVEIRRF